MAFRESFRDRAVVIRTYDFGEADRIVVLLTRNNGLVRSVAKGVRRAKSRFGSRLQPFVDVDVQLYPGRNLATITQADTVRYYGSGIIDDFDKYAAGCAILESAERLSYADSDNDPFLFDEVTASFEELQRVDYATVIVDKFILRATDHAGWGLSLFDCAQCQRQGPHRAFHPAVGGAVCNNCRPQGSADVHEETLHLMWLLQHDHMAAAEAMATATFAAQAHRLTSAHLQWHVEQGIKSLKIMEQA
ncbi:DNA repair protein RecO [Corynebacterium breve]|uniref:DNA repair protein RecO n=1 Tax=Corynebacterium breve TaxID=3049799 RepID=A0ABY8VBM7_9CORY|nr:DNA repair protein RecO [Corynebacterium breve]WIM67080.1 DNA repair protein RecO [Corynebacterium breve]